MEVSLKKTVEELGYSRVSRESGIPVSTLWRWADEGIPTGKDGKHDYRARHLAQVIERLQAQQASA